jgi:hypothetical protein
MEGCDDAQKKGEHFFNLFDLEYQKGTSVFDFYSQYRNLFVASLKKKGDKILWQNRVLTDDEQLSPTFEDLILANLLFLIDVRLPGCVRDHYQHLIDKTKSLMDYKEDILSRTPEFFREIEGEFCTISEKDGDRIERYLYFCCSTLNGVRSVSTRARIHLNMKHLKSIDMF